MNSNNNQTNKNNTISPITITRNKNDNTPDQDWTVKNSANSKRNHSSSSASEPPSPSTNKQIDKNPKKKFLLPKIDINYWVKMKIKITMQLRPQTQPPQLLNKLMKSHQSNHRLQFLWKVSRIFLNFAKSLSKLLE